LKFAAPALLVAAGIAAWALYRQKPVHEAAPRTAGRGQFSPESSLVARAMRRLRRNRLAAQEDDNALDLYLQALARIPRTPRQGPGLAEVQERLWTKAESALLEERLTRRPRQSTRPQSRRRRRRDRVVTARLANHATPQNRGRPAPRTPDDTRPETSADAARRAERLVSPRHASRQGHLIDSDNDSARFYVREALRIDPAGNAVQAARSESSLRRLWRAPCGSRKP